MRYFPPRPYSNFLGRWNLSRGGSLAPKKKKKTGRVQKVWWSGLIYQWCESQKWKGGEVGMGRVTFSAYRQDRHRDTSLSGARLLFSLSCFTESTLLSRSRRRQAWHLAHRGAQRKAGQGLRPATPPRQGQRQGLQGSVGGGSTWLGTSCSLGPQPRRLHYLEGGLTCSPRWSKPLSAWLRSLWPRAPKQGPSEASHLHLGP